MNGKIKFFNPIKKFGFIIENGCDAEYFFHTNDSIDKSFNENDSVTFDVAPSRVKENSVNAINVKKLI